MGRFKKNTIKKKLWFLFFLIFLFSVSETTAQNKVVVIPLIDDSKSKSIIVYDSSIPPQYLGIYAGYAPGAGAMYSSVFNTALNLFLIIEDDPGAPNYGNVKTESYNIDEGGNIWLQQRDRLIRLSNGTYVAGVGNPLYINGIGWRYGYREVLTDEIPFKLPVTMPLNYEYK